MSEGALICQRNMRDWYLARVAAAGGTVSHDPGMIWGHLAQGLKPPGAGRIVAFPDVRDTARVGQMLDEFRTLGTTPWCTLAPPLSPLVMRPLLKQCGFSYQFSGLCMRRPQSTAPVRATTVAGIAIRPTPHQQLEETGLHPSYGAMSDPAARASLRAANALAAQTPPAYQMFGAFDGATLVGSVALFFAADGIGLYDLATRTEYRRRGIGEALLRTAIAAAEQDGTDRPLVLQCDASLERFYGACGFVREGRIEHWTGPQSHDQVQIDDEMPDVAREDLAAAIGTADVAWVADLLADTPGLADLPLPDGAGYPLHLAAYHGVPGAARLLLTANAQPEARDTRYDASPMGWALTGLSSNGPDLKAGQVEVIQQLVAAGARPGKAEIAQAQTLGPGIAAHLLTGREGTQ